MFNTRRFQRTAFLAMVALLFAAVSSPAFQLGSRDTQEWIERLERPERIQGLKIDEVISRLGLKPGTVLADIGAGTGAFSFPFAKAVGSSGKVYAVDVDAGLLDYINQKAKKGNVTNIQTVRGEFGDPKIPTRAVDIAFFHDVLHHVEDRAGYLKALAGYIKPDGRIALIEMNRDDPNTPHRNDPEMLVSKDQVNQWMAAAGLHPVEEFDLFGNSKWFVVYQKGAAPQGGDMDHSGMDHHGMGM